MKTLLTLLLTVLTGYSATYSGVVSGNNLGNQNSTGTNITIKGLKGWSTNFNGTNMTFVGGSFTGATNTGGVYSGGAYTGTLTGTNAVLTTPSITGGTNTSSIINSPTITGGTVASALTGTNAVLTAPAITGGTNTSGLFLNSTLTGFTSSLQTNTDLTASRALVSDSAQRVTNSAVTATELGYVSGVTSALQTQLNAKGAATNGTFSGGTFAGATNTNPQIVGGFASQLAISGQAVVTSTNASITPFVIVGAAGQTANAFMIQTNGGTVQMLVTKEGAMGIGGASTSYKLQLTGAGSYNTLGGCAIGMHNTTAAQIWAQAAHNDTAFFWQDVTGNQTKMALYPGANGALDFYTGTGYTTINGTGGLKVAGKAFLGGTSTPQYTLDLNGQARILGTNGMRFGGTSGATDDTVRISQTSANNLLLTATATTTSGSLTPSGRLILPMGEISYFSTTGTLITIGGTSDGSSNMQVVDPTTALSSGVYQFDNGGGDTGRLRYTGTTTRMFHIAITMSGTPANANDIFVFGAAKNGTVVSASKVLGSNSGTQFSALHAMVELATNDYIELYVGNTSGTRNFTVQSLNIYALGH